MAETVVSVCFVVQPACIGAQGGGGGLSAFVESFAHLFTSVCAPVCGCVLSGLKPC